MPRLILLLSGLADDPHDALDGKTPLESAATPNLDQLAAVSEVGLCRPVPERPLDDPAIGADLTTLALFGYAEVPGCRGALELLGAGAGLGLRDSGFRLDLLSPGEPFPAPPTADESEQLWGDLATVCTRSNVRIRRTSRLRGLGLWTEGPVDVLVPPPGQLDGDLDSQLPQGDQDDAIRRLIDDARELLYSHPVNLARRHEGQPTYEVLWPWGFGRAPRLRMFVFKTGHLPVVLADHLAVRGAAMAAAVTAPQTGQADKGRPHELAGALVPALERADSVVAHHALADRAGHTGDPERKKWAVEQFDALLIGPVMELLEKDRSLELTILTDYACSSVTRRHANRPVPYLAFRPARRRSGPGRFDENEATEAGRLREGARDLLGWLWGR
ncbi:MAG: hypothetical protein HYU66_17040 [Armatimonadetes bacterium]|nr:hypothetical protein [Armatimonadota bacterium]